MEIILGLIIGILGTYIIMDKKKPKTNKQKLTKEEKKKQERIKKAFNNLMEYDYETACRRD